MKVYIVGVMKGGACSRNYVRTDIRLLKLKVMLNGCYFWAPFFIL